ncbi:hypothetical protein MesoLjLb_72340 [Mesorhizobium sp. L-8-3]|nr:hypothetical protein MesoLjLb_72340 [Mesorhizobium sp. L-8-3]
MSALRSPLIRPALDAILDKSAACLRTPLCPAGHLPHKGGDWPAAWISPIVNVAGPSSMTAALPPRGDVRQDREGYLAKPYPTEIKRLSALLSWQGLPGASSPEEAA